MKNSAVTNSLNEYVKNFEEIVKKYPNQWFNLYNFWENWWKLIIDERYITLSEIINSDKIEISNDKKFIDHINETHNFLINEIKKMGSQYMVLQQDMELVVKTM